MMNFEYDASQDVLSGERLTTAYMINQPSKTLRLNDAGFSEQTKQLKAEIHSNGAHDNIGMMHGIILQKIPPTASRLSSANSSPRDHFNTILQSSTERKQTKCKTNLDVFK